VKPERKREEKEKEELSAFPQQKRTFPLSGKVPQSDQ
jgi:hypothetical protein